jgi:hypothetical protein
MLSSSQTKDKNSVGTSGSYAAGFADWLCLAAAPTFAIMAILTVVTGGADMICSSMPGASALDGMVTMYLIMSAFHLPPWLRLLSSRGWSARS